MYFYESMFGYAPLLFATYPALALRLPGFDEQRLKSSLAKALQALPTVAGRFRDDSKKMVLNGAGVPLRSLSPRSPRLQRSSRSVRS